MKIIRNADTPLATGDVLQAPILQDGSGVQVYATAG